MMIISEKLSLETPIVRVFRGETWFTVYRSIALLRIRWELVGRGTNSRESVVFCDENQKLFARSQLWAYKFTKGPIRCSNLQM